MPKIRDDVRRLHHSKEVVNGMWAVHLDRGIVVKAKAAIVHLQQVQQLLLSKVQPLTRQRNVVLKGVLQLILGISQQIREIRHHAQVLDILPRE